MTPQIAQAAATELASFLLRCRKIELGLIGILAYFDGHDGGPRKRWRGGYKPSRFRLRRSLWGAENRDFENVVIVDAGHIGERFQHPHKFIARIAFFGRLRVQRNMERDGDHGSAGSGEELG